MAAEEEGGGEKDSEGQEEEGDKVAKEKDTGMKKAARMKKTVLPGVLQSCRYSVPKEPYTSVKRGLCHIYIYIYIYIYMYMYICTCI